MSHNDNVYGSNAVSLLLELRRSRWLPQYNEAVVRRVVEEIHLLHKNMFQVIHVKQYDVSDPSVTCGLLAHGESNLRSKRCVLAYLNHRAKKIKDVWWERGAVLPVENKSVLCEQEVKFFEDYDQLVAGYISDVGGLDLKADQTPPKDLFIEVRALKDYGEIVTDTGVVMLTKDSVHFLRRSDAEMLIRQGILAETETKH